MYDPDRLKNEAKNTDILSVAKSLGMELDKISSHYYSWKLHDSLIIDTDKNIYHWFSRGLRGKDTIDLVERINNVSFKEALQHILGLDAQVLSLKQKEPQKPFVYRVPEAKSFDYARKYLKNERGLSDETIDFFLSKGVIAQGIYKDYKTGETEPVVVFKNVDLTGRIVGGALQGIWYNKQKYKKKGRLKKTLRGSEHYSGFQIDVGEKKNFAHSTKEAPFKLYVFEGPLDMMAYYDLHKERLNNARLVALHGLNKGTISKSIVDALCSDIESYKKLEENVIPAHQWLRDADEKGFTDKLKIIIATDNDKAGKEFFLKLGLKHTKVVPHMPPLRPGATKADWNDHLKLKKQEQLVKKSQHMVASVIQKEHSSELYI